MPSGSLLYKFLGIEPWSWLGAGGGATDIDFPDGPNSSAHGQPFWIDNDATGWYVAFDIDAVPDPDIRQLLEPFLQDAGVLAAYRADVRRRAIALGWRP